MFDIIVVRELTLSALDFVTNGINTKLCKRFYVRKYIKKFISINKI